MLAGECVVAFQVKFRVLFIWVDAHAWAISRVREFTLMAKSKPEEEPLETPPDADMDVQAVESVSSLADETSATEGAEAAVEKPLYEKYGLDDSFKDATDHDTLVKRLADDRKAREDRFQSELSERQREWQRQTQDFLTQKQWRDEQRAKAEASQKVEPKKWWNPPVQRSADWDQYIKTNPETGEVEIQAPTDQIKNDILAYARYKREHDDRWNTDREGYLREFVNEVVPGIIQTQVRQYQEAQHEQARLGQLEVESADWLYQKNGDEFVRDPEGSPYLTAVGIQVMDYARFLHQRGLGSQPDCFEAARDAIIGRTLLAERARAEQDKRTKESNDKRKLDTLDSNATRRKNRSGADAKVETRDPPLRTKKSIDRWRAAFEEAGVFTPDGELITN